MRNGWKVLNYIWVILNVIVPSPPRPHMHYKWIGKTMRGIKKKSNGCQSEVTALLCLLLWWAGLSSLNASVACSEQATSFTKNSQSTSPHLMPMPYESWLSPNDCLFPFETAILSWPGGFFSGNLFKGTGQASNEHWYVRSGHVLARPSSRRESNLLSSPSQVMVWGFWYQRFGGVIGGSLLPTGAKAWVTPMLYAAQESFDNRVWRLVSSCIHL